MNAEQEFAVAVATEVWGWKFKKAEYHAGNLVASSGWFDSNDKRAYPTENLEKVPFQNTCQGFQCDEDLIPEVYSWPGFGRTLEAGGYQQMLCEFEAYIDGFITKEELWHETHKAALKARRVETIACEVLEGERENSSKA